MNLEFEKYEGELRMLRERVIELEKEVAWLYHEAYGTRMPDNRLMHAETQSSM